MRISNTQLEYYENTIASALSIIQELKALIYYVDDPDQLRMMANIMADAQDIRRLAIHRMNSEKGKAQ